MNDKKRRTCPACHYPQNARLGEKNGFYMLVCKNCHSIYSSYLPKGVEAEDYDAYYTEENLKIPPFILERLNDIIQSFKPYFQNGRLLDVGFGAGSIMEVAQDIGWQVKGVEVSRPAIEHARRLGFEVFHGELSEAKYPDNSFDVVTASEIIEHCPQPEIMLDEIMRILRPGGLFWATTPSANGLSYQLIGLDWTIICPPEHLQLFSKKGVKIMFNKAGFSQLEIKTFGFNPLEVTDNFRRRLQKTDSKKEEFNRVCTGYALNESLTKSPVRKTIKNLLNGTLDFLSVGDSLKIRAVK